MEYEKQETYNLIVNMVKERLAELSKQIEDKFQSDLIMISAGINQSVQIVYEKTIDTIVEKGKKSVLTIILTTNGGELPNIINMVDKTREHYKIVNFIIYSGAISAGTLFAFSGNNIYASSPTTGLGTIDVQVDWMHYWSCGVRSDGYSSLYYLKKHLDKPSEWADNYLRNHFTEDEIKIHNAQEKSFIRKYESYQDTINKLAETYLTHFHFGHEVDSDEKRSKIKNIVTILSDPDEYEKLGYIYHGQSVSTSNLKKLGLIIKECNRQDSLLIDEFWTLAKQNLAFKYHTNLSNNRDYFIYCRHNDTD